MKKHSLLAASVALALIGAVQQASQPTLRFLDSWTRGLPTGMKTATPG